jgi:hypothetical protein
MYHVARECVVNDYPSFNQGFRLHVVQVLLNDNMASALSETGNHPMSMNP